MYWSNQLVSTSKVLCCPEPSKMCMKGDEVLVNGCLPSVSDVVPTCCSQPEGCACRLAAQEQAMKAQHAEQVKVIQGELQAVRTALQEERSLSSQRAQLEAQVQAIHG